MFLEDYLKILKSVRRTRCSSRSHVLCSWYQSKCSAAKFRAMDWLIAKQAPTLKRGKCLKLKATFSRVLLRILKILEVSECVRTKVVLEKTVMKQTPSLSQFPCMFAMNQKSSEAVAAFLFATRKARTTISEQLGLQLPAGCKFAARICLAFGKLQSKPFSASFSEKSKLKFAKMFDEIQMTCRRRSGAKACKFCYLVKSFQTRS